MQNETRCGFVAIVGRPNVGKSTLLNRILGKKVSITSRKPQTTRQQILGIKTHENVQTIYVDTPGIHNKEPRAINRYMNRAALSSLYDVDVIIFLIDARYWNAGDDTVLARLQEVDKPVIIVLNKVDKVSEKKSLLPVIENIKNKMNFSEIIPLSAKEGTGVDDLEKTIANYLKPAPFFYDKDQVTTRDDRFQAAEIIREKLIRNLGEELPFSTAVEIEDMKLDNNIIHINAVVWVEREGQKAIVIGKDGLHLKRIATDARKDIEKTLNSKVFLRVWVKCKDNWSDSEKMLNHLGLGN